MSENLGGSSLKTLVLGRPRDLSDRHIFHQVSLVAVLAWVGLGADGLSSSCYGPEECYKALGQYPALAIFIAFACVATILVICASYRQIIELFPTGGGGYLVASKLISPKAGLVSGSALLVDYVLTITISVASSGDALFSLLPERYLHYKFLFDCVGVFLLTMINLRGARESVMLFAPVFFLFVLTHGLAIFGVIGTHLAGIGTVAHETSTQLQAARAELGVFGILALLLKAFSVGAGTYTGIEAVSNGLPILREPKVVTGKKTMNYMGISLALTVFGLLVAYLLEDVHPVEGQTLNAVLFGKITANWPGQTGHWFTSISMISAACLLFIAAQAGFLDGPRVAANMAIDRWFPNRFATLSDRFVTQNGILLMGAAALIAMVLTRGEVGLLVVLYSINVFVTFSLSQLGMVMHWWRERKTEPKWRGKLIVNGIGLGLTSFILITLCCVKFFEGGWITIIVTAVLVVLAVLIKRHYEASREQLKRLDGLVKATEDDPTQIPPRPVARGRTAIVLVNGFNGLGLHTYYGIFRMFPKTFTDFIFVQVGTVDAGTFKGTEELKALQAKTENDGERYVAMCAKHGYTAKAISRIGIDIVSTAHQVTNELLKDNRSAVIIGGQLACEKETVWTRWLHNYVVFALQRVFCREGVPFVIVPARV
jgi:amino acid transporter